MQDQARQPVAPLLGLGGLVVGQPGAARSVAVLDVGG
jgi:hypothetical protein